MCHIEQCTPVIIFPKKSAKEITQMAGDGGVCRLQNCSIHYNDVIISASANQQPHDCLPFIQGADQRKHQSSASLAFVKGIHRSPVNCPHKGPVTRKMFPFDDVIMCLPFSRKGCKKYCQIALLMMISCLLWKLFWLYWLIVRGIHRWSVDSPRHLVVSLLLAEQAAQAA